MKHIILVGCFVVVFGLCIAPLIGLAGNQGHNKYVIAPTTGKATDKAIIVSTIATAHKEAIVVIDRETTAEKTDLTLDYLVIDLTLVAEDPSKPYALDITVECNDKCPSDKTAKKAADTYHIGRFNINPTLKVGESRTLTIPVAKGTIPSTLSRLRIELESIIEGRGVGSHAVKINSAKFLHTAQ